MKIKLLKKWTKPSGLDLPKGTVVEVTRDLGFELAEKRIAQIIEEEAVTPPVPDDDRPIPQDEEEEEEEKFFK